MSDPQWGIVKQLNPLRVQLATDTAPKDITPAALATGLAVGDTVWCQIVAGQLVIYGKKV